jgi:hypothetical protein
MSWKTVVLFLAGAKMLFCTTSISAIYSKDIERPPPRGKTVGT